MMRVCQWGKIMTRTPAIAIAAAIAMSAALAVAAPPPDAPAPTTTVTVVHCARLIDTVAGKLLGATTIVVEGDRINEVVAGNAATSRRDGDRPAGERHLPARA